jgi:thioredoxin-like negative regulator of GroEL
MAEAATKPTILFFGTTTDGRCRRVEGFLSQVLQRRRNHETFVVRYVAADQRPDLAEKFRIDQTPALLVVADKRVQARLIQPRGCVDIQSLLAPWLKPPRLYDRGKSHE